VLKVILRLWILKQDKSHCNAHSMQGILFVDFFYTATLFAPFLKEDIR